MIRTISAQSISASRCSTPPTRMAPATTNGSSRRRSGDAASACGSAPSSAIRGAMRTTRRSACAAARSTCRSRAIAACSASASTSSSVCAASRRSGRAHRGDRRRHGAPGRRRKVRAIGLSEASAQTLAAPTPCTRSPSSKPNIAMEPRAGGPVAPACRELGVTLMATARSAADSWRGRRRAGQLRAQRPASVMPRFQPDNLAANCNVSDAGKPGRAEPMQRRSTRAGVGAGTRRRHRSIPGTRRPALGGEPRRAVDRARCQRHG